MNYYGIKTLKAQVEHCLELVPESRNSDVRLTLEVWCRFYPEHIVEDAEGRQWVTLQSILELPREDNIKRARAYFQNTKGKYLPTVWDVAKARKINIDEWRVAMGYPTVETAGTPKPSYTPPSLEEGKVIARAVYTPPIVSHADGTLEQGGVQIDGISIEVTP